MARKGEARVVADGALLAANSALVHVGPPIGVTDEFIGF